MGPTLLLWKKPLPLNWKKKKNHFIGIDKLEFPRNLRIWSPVDDFYRGCNITVHIIFTLQKLDGHADSDLTYNPHPFKLKTFSE